MQLVSKHLVIPVLAAMFVPVSAAKAVNLLTNGSFETGTYTFGGDGGQNLAPGSTVMTGWTVVTNNVAPLTTPNSYSVVAQDGFVSLDLQGYSDGVPYGGVQQLLPTTPGAQYQLSFWVGVVNGANGNVPASVTVSADATSQNFANTLSAPGQQWQQFSMNFTASGPTTTITLAGLSASAPYIGLDNVTVDLISLPEPASLSILSLAAVSLLMRRRK